MYLKFLSLIKNSFLSQLEKSLVCQRFRSSVMCGTNEKT